MGIKDDGLMEGMIQYTIWRGGEEWWFCLLGTEVISNPNLEAVNFNP